MPRLIKKDSTDVTLYVSIQDSSDGSPETGITITDLDLQYVRFGAVPVAKVDATELAATNSAHADNQMKEVDATDQPGIYRVDWPDAAFATGVSGVILTVKGTGFHPADYEVQLVDFDPDDVVRLGLTALPNANADAAGGLTISDAGGLDLDNKLANTNEVTAARMAVLTDWINGGRLDLILDIIAADVVNVDGSAIPTAVQNRQEMDSNSTQLGAIVTDTNELQTDWVDGGRLDLLVDAIKAVTDLLPNAGALSDLAAIKAVTDLLPDAGALNDLATILADTNELQTDWTDGGRLDLLVDAIKAVTDLLPDAGALNDLATILADTNELQGDWANGGRLDLLVDAIKAVTDLLPDAGALNDLAAILTDTGTTIPALIAALNDLSAADIATELATYDAPTKAEMDAAHALLATVAKQDVIDGIVDAILVDTGTTIPALISALNDLSSADVATELATYDAPTKAEMDAAHALLSTAAGLATVDAVVDAILVDTDVTIPGLIAALNNLSVADVNAEVVDVIDTDTSTEPGQGAPPVIASLRTKLDYLYKFLRNKEDNDGTWVQKYDDAGVVVDHKASASDVAGTSTRGEFVTGP